MVREGSVAANSADAAPALVAKARAELRRADELVQGAAVIKSSGGPFAGVVLVKGTPGAIDLEKGHALAGEDGDAARKAIAALGYDGPFFGTISRPAGAEPGAAASRLRLQIEAVEAAAVVALDATAAEDLAAAFGLPPLAFGVAVHLSGRTLLAVDGLEASLSEDARKRRVWEQFKGLVAPGSRESERDARRRPADSALF